MSKFKLAALIIVCLCLAGLAGYKLHLQQQRANTYTGGVEVTTIDIKPKLSGYIETLSITEGEILTAGELAATISRDDLAAQLERDAIALEKAAVQLTDLEKGARDQELRAAQAAIHSAAAVADNTAADYRRCQQLYEDDAIARQQLDSAKSAYLVAANNLAKAQEDYELLLAGNRSDVILAQKLEVDRLNAVLTVTKTTLADTVVTSPCTGVILTKNFEQGEYVAAGNSLATLAVTDDCWVKIYVPSTELGGITLGQAADIAIDSHPGQLFNGSIKEIGSNAEFTPRQSITKEERANMVFAVKIRIDNKEGIFKPGMPADVTLL